jgi:large subunit ribosomal protein L21
MKFAIVESGGKQYKAVEGGTIEVDRLPVEPGANIKLEQVLLLADGETITVGTPVVKDSPVWARVQEHFKGEKVTIFNYSPKKRIRVKTGHRQNYTRLLIEQIGGAEFVEKKPAPKVEKAAPKAKQPEAEGDADAAPVKSKAEPKPAARKTSAKAESKPAAKPARKAKAEPKAKSTSKPAAKKSDSK